VIIEESGDSPPVSPPVPPRTVFPSVGLHVAGHQPVGCALLSFSERPLHLLPAGKRPAWPLDRAQREWGVAAAMRAAATRHSSAHVPLPPACVVAPGCICAAWRAATQQPSAPRLAFGGRACVPGGACGVRGVQRVATVTQP